MKKDCLILIMNIDNIASIQLFIKSLLLMIWDIFFCMAWSL